MASISDSPFEIKTSELLGRYLVAKQDLPGGTLVFEEAPLFVYSKFREAIRDQSKSSCISCYQKVETKKVVECIRCKWHFCSLECSQNPWHVKEECKILSRNEILPDEPETLCLLYFLRFEILRKKERNKWEEIMTLVSTPAIANLEYNQLVYDTALLAQEFLKRCRMEVSLVYLKAVINIFRLNAFSLKADKMEPMIGVYGIFCLFSHCCSPNCEWYHITDGKARGTMGLLSRRDIAAGEMVTITYLGSCLSLGSRHRQVSISARFHYICACARCMDASEFGSFFSAIKCRWCPDGWLLPPTCFSNDNESRCNKCNHSMASGEVERTEFAFRQKVVGATMKDTGFKSNIKFQEKCLDDLISKATSQYKLHANHNLVILAIQRWLRIRSFKILLKSTEKSRILYEKIIERAGRALAICNRFGVLYERVELEATIACAMIWFHLKSKDYVNIGKDIDNLSDKIEIIKEIVSYLEKVVPLLRYDFFDDRTAAIIYTMSVRCVNWMDHLVTLQRKRRLNDHHA